MNRRWRRLLCRLGHPARRRIWQEHEGRHPWAPYDGATWVIWWAEGWACRWCDRCQVTFTRWPWFNTLDIQTWERVRSQAELEGLVRDAIEDHYRPMRAGVLS